MSVRRKRTPSLASSYRRAISQWTRLTHSSLNTGRRAAGQAMALNKAAARQSVPVAGGAWLSGVAMGPAGMRRFRLYRPPGMGLGERRPLLVMLHGCGQDAAGFALSTRMNRIAAREGCFVLYPEQDRSAHPHGCWHWYGTRSGQAQREATTLAAAIDQVCLLYPVDATRVAIAGLSAGASMAALMVTREPARFCALVMHSGIAPGLADSSMTALKAMRGRSGQAAPARPGPLWPPLLVIQGDADGVVAASNGAAMAQFWAEQAGALGQASREVRRGRRRAMNVTDYKAGGRLVASLCRVEGLGHAWSGGDARQPLGDAQGPDASRMVWSFAARQFRTPA
ncbi:MAG: prolyl oligopeptidase family serine peptidase [Methylibium sp.]|uniref:extracellular catalytic domain type 1 short-chain-length polyhydroxyalkanoate depolymerase n=1 Tax=Methylibium sp. TaxID=2067992 RepID=UPI00179C0826|nr:PHB depolymerase family esterase [Methylibium sp.]MBA2721952.1 prolyl oligopeptidase family serine peptidase [Methylibium sp.]MBA3590651.1 prolyl oligopeptidase family serine peptidase [Methylibium sp.]